MVDLGLKPDDDLAIEQTLQARSCGIGAQPNLPTELPLSNPTTTLHNAEDFSVNVIYHSGSDCTGSP